jgi:uncharacterized membrane protein
MKLLGHPIHLLLIHFPTALLPMDDLFSIFSYYTKDSSYMPVAFYCLQAGVLCGIAAIVTGLVDFLRISGEKKIAKGTAMIHGFINTTVLLFYGIFAYRSVQLFPHLVVPGVGILVLKTALLLTLFVGNYLGGKLVLEYGIGTKNKNTLL